MSASGAGTTSTSAARAFSTAGLVGSLPFVSPQLRKIHDSTLFVPDKADGLSSGQDMVALLTA